MNSVMHHVFAGPLFASEPINFSLFNRIRAMVGTSDLGQEAALYQALITFRDELAKSQVATNGAQPAFWFRPRSDGGFDGPIPDNSIEEVRKRSGAWHPLFKGDPPAPDPNATRGQPK